ncbi:MAG: altronate dehydratase [Planctomycetales bacterium]|nr:altronate dehydratase [Planctomycetales bacterium]
MDARQTSDVVQLSPRDTVVVALRDLAVGQTVDIGGQALAVRDDIPAGHKLAIRQVPQDAAVIKFGWSIGLASRAIAPGEHVHSHNLRCDHTIDSEAISTEVPAALESPGEFTFQGYERADGQVGTRNYLAVISNVNCSASVARMISQKFDAAALAAFPNVDGVISFRHEGGCAMAFEGSRHRMLSRVLGGMARHPNVGGFLLVGLGCEQGTLEHLVQSQRLHHIDLPAGHEPTSVQGRGNPLPVLTMQNLGGTRATVQRGTEVVAQMLHQVNAARRTTVPAARLILATECGGSDGYSGITANPALGAAADRVVACGGTVILSETSEIYGAEHLLTRRARTRAVAEKLLERIEWWKWYCRNYGEELDNNPSVGNKAGGLTTITEKSLGAVSKGGSTALEAVYEYAEPVRQAGFVVMDSPGFDPASVTGMVAGGANAVAFTTGRGSCFGFKPVPSFKIASNSQLYHRLREDMDFNAGRVLEGQSVQDVGHDLFLQLLATASGQATCSERLGIGEEEFVPWLVGPVL